VFFSILLEFWGLARGSLMSKGFLKMQVGKLVWLGAGMVFVGLQRDCAGIDHSMADLLCSVGFDALTWHVL